MTQFADAMKEFQDHPTLEPFKGSLQADLLIEALKVTGSASIRRRKLPAEQVLWLTIGMALYTNCSIQQIVDRLNLTINGKVVSSTVSDARKRLGPEPLEYLFKKYTQACMDLKENDLWKGLKLMGIDGTMLRVQDTEENEKYFGKPGSSRAGAAYPQVRLVATMDLNQRMIQNVNFGPLSKGENTLASEMIDVLPDNSLCLMDRGFMSFAHFYKVVGPEKNRHFLCRARTNAKFKIEKILPDGTTLAKLQATPSAQKKTPGMPKTMTVRVIEYKVEGHGLIRLFTSLVDDKKYPGRELATLYHQRWELEIAFDELKTDMLNRKESLRSKSVEGVEQEIWSLLLVYNLVRREMALIAHSHSTSASKLSFKASLVFINDFFIIHSQDTATGLLSKHLKALREEIWRYRLPPRRSERSSPRHVKIKMSSYPKKPPNQRLKGSCA